MFVAIQAKDRSRVTSIACEWDTKEDRLRELTADGQLICPGCEQRLWLRTGQTRRRHFAHRTLVACPLAHESAEILEIKAVLYRWLETKYPTKVHLEMIIGQASPEPAADLLVEPDARHKFAYWVFDRQQRDRARWLSRLQTPGLSTHFIHAASTLNLQNPDQVLLTASQRDFIQRSDYDHYTISGIGGHLHYVNAEDSTVSILRGLWRVHKPNIHRYTRLCSGPLDSALISPKTGEILLADDVEARKIFLEHMPSRKSVSMEPRQQANPEPPDTGGEPVVDLSAPEEPRLNLNGPFRCEICGVMTLDWSQASPSEGTCICRDCLKQRGNRIR
jgi:hypothetical protein